MTGGTGEGLHMWNVVSIGGANYLVDVTNCDGEEGGSSNSVGFPNKLFLCGGTGTTDGKTYTATVTHDSGSTSNIQYTYDDETWDNYNPDELALSALPYKPLVELTGKVTIDGEAKINVELTANTSGLPSDATGLTYQWYRVKDGKQTLIDGATKATYTPSTKDDMGKHIMVEVSATNYSGSIQRMTDNTVVKGAGSQIPAAPTLGSVTADSIAVSHSLTGLEFACVKAGTSLDDESWQENMSFNNLEANTEYEIYARSKATDTHEASDHSLKLTVFTKKKTVKQDIIDEWKKGIKPYEGTYDGTSHPAVTVISGLVPGSGWVVKYGESTSSYIGSVPMVTDVNDNRERWVWFEHDDYEPVKIPYTVNISPKSITPTVDLSSTSFTYDGTAKKPTVTVKDPDGTTVLNPDTDYTVSGETSGTDADIYTITVACTGNYSGTGTASWTINRAKPEYGDFTITKPTPVDYNGQPHSVTEPTTTKPGIGNVTVYYEGQNPTMYDRKTQAPTNAGNYTVTFDVAETNNCEERLGLLIGGLTINKIDQTITGENFSIKKGSAVDLSNKFTSEGALTFEITGENNTGSSISTSDNKTLTAGDKEGTFTLKVTAAETENYKPAEKTVTVTVSNKLIDTTAMTVTQEGCTYGDMLPAYNITIMPIEQGAKTAYYNGTLKDGSAYNSNTAPTKAGSYTVKVTYETDAKIYEATAGFTISPRTVTITGVTAKDKVYDGTTDATVTDPARIDGLLDADNVTVTPGTAAFADKNVGTGKTVTFSGYTLKGNDGAENNYALTQPASVNANITAKKVTITGVTATTRYYIEGNVNVTVDGGTVDGAISSDDVTVNMDHAKGTMADANAGTGKSVTVTGYALDGTDAGNYKLKEQPTGVTVNITPATYMGTMDASGSAKYGASGTVDLSGLIVAGGTASYKSATDTSSVLNGTPAMDGTTLRFAFVNDSSKVTNTATIKVTVTSTNYHPYDITVTVTVNDKTVPTVTAPTAKTLIYNGSEQVLIAAGSTSGGTMQYSLTSGGPYDAALPKGKDAKSYTVYYKVEGNTEYADVAENSITVNIGQKAVTVAPKAVSITKGSAIPTFELVYTGLVSGESLTPSAAPTFTCFEADGSTAVSTSTAAGNYTITWTNKDTTTFTDAGNYDVTKTATANLTISNPPVTPPGGSSSGGGSSSSDRDTSGSGTVKTETTKNDDGSTTRTETKKDGTVIETTTGKDGSVSKTETKTETKKDGTKVETRAETVTNKDGSKSTSKTEITTAKDGTVTESKSETRTGADGTKSVTKAESKTDENGVTSGTETTTTTAPNGSTGTTTTTTENGSSRTEAETKLSSKAVEEAKRNGEPVKAPVEVEAARNSDSAPTVKIELPKSAGDTKVEIPVTNVKPGTVAVLVHPDGTEEIIKDSIPTENGVQLTVSGGATVKILDNSKDFGDIQSHWAKDAIDFVSARGLVNGINPTLYSPNASATRAQLWTILARQSDAELNGGANWYEKAQNWAKDKGISDGADPNGTINRAQMVTMLWRAMGEPVVEITHSFTDIAADNYYAQAVAWAVRNGITTGVGDGRFDPNGACTRGQIAAFLMRYCSAK